MTKFLVALTGLVALSTATIPLAQQADKTDVQQETYSNDWNFQSTSVSKNVGANEWLYFAVDNINLSSMGISSINQLHSYSRIEIPGLVLKFDDRVVQSGDTWGTSNRNIGSEDWYRMFKKTSDWTTMYLESAATLWYSNSGSLMMRLAYHASMVTYIPPSVTMGGNISFESGSVVKFY